MHHTSNFVSKGKLWTKCCLYIKPACSPLLEQTLACAASDARYNNSSSTSATRGSCCNLLLWTIECTEEGTALEVPKESCCVVFAFISKKHRHLSLCSLLFVSITLNWAIFTPRNHPFLFCFAFFASLVKSEVMKSCTGKEKNRLKEKAWRWNRTITASKPVSSWTTGPPLCRLRLNCDGWI